MTALQMLREIFGDGAAEEESPRSPANTTPAFRLADAMPEFAGELRRLLMDQGEVVLAESVGDLWVYDRCRCGADYCATIYTVPVPEGRFPEHGGLSVFPATGAVNIDLTGGRIGCIEALDVPGIGEKLLSLLP